MDNWPCYEKIRDEEGVGTGRLNNTLIAFTKMMEMVDSGYTVRVSKSLHGDNQYVIIVVGKEISWSERKNVSSSNFAEAVNIIHGMIMGDS